MFTKSFDTTQALSAAASMMCWLSSSHAQNELSQRLVRYFSIDDATLEGAVSCRW